MIRLVIKGTVADATEAARARGVVLIFDSTLPQTPRETKVNTPSPEAEIQKWYAETPKSPFPPGTLLHYRSLAQFDEN